MVDGRVDGLARSGGEGGMVIVRRAADERAAVSSSATARVMSILNWVLADRRDRVRCRWDEISLISRAGLS